MKKILVVCAHPDDETLGLGGTLYLQKQIGSKVFVLFFADGETSRGLDQKAVKTREIQAKNALSILGINHFKFLRYPDQLLEQIPLLDLSKQIESVINKWNPDTIFTHFYGDLNQDHRRIFEATMIASRPIPSSKINHLLCFETPSSTEWGLNNFNPNYFVNITNGLNKKIQAIKKYSKEIQPSPHPRSIESLTARASYWGSKVGKKYAEAFYQIRKVD
jgi:LmbE family N-acetylglucosaminyl deacetylase